MLQYVDAVFAFAAALGSPDLSVSDPAVLAAILTIAEDPSPAAGATVMDGDGAGACSTWATRVGRPADAGAIMSAHAGNAHQCVSASFGQDALTSQACEDAAAEVGAPAARWYRIAALVCDCVDGDGSQCMPAAELEALQPRRSKTFPFAAVP